MTQETDTSVKVASIVEAKIGAMTLNDYQSWAQTTAIYPTGRLTGIIYCGLKLNGEAGEVAEKIGKLMRDKAGEITPTFQLDTALELSDVLWYIANLARELGYTLQQIAEMNKHKLNSRKDRGKLQGSGDNR